MDLRMPVMNGLEATREIRKRLALSSLIIVAFTGELMDAAWASEFNGTVFTATVFTTVFTTPLPSLLLVTMAFTTSHYCLYYSY